MKILLFGSSGGIGSAIKDSLNGHQVVCPTRSAPLTVFPNEEKFDLIIFAQGQIDESEVLDTFDANIIGIILLTDRFLISSERFIFISSTAGIKGNAMFPVYAASKAALNIYSKSMALRYTGKQFYSICPGPTDTKMWRSLGLRGEAQAPSEIAKVVQRIINSEFKSGDIITVRDGKVTV